MRLNFYSHRENCVYLQTNSSKGGEILDLLFFFFFRKFFGNELPTAERECSTDIPAGTKLVGSLPDGASKSRGPRSVAPDGRVIDLPLAAAAKLHCPRACALPTKSRTCAHCGVGRSCVVRGQTDRHREPRLYGLYTCT